ncbi:SurA N-terminal domain-containing protein [Salinactinospora qingdaonensis]|uniref:SurA N-terminal domain-containing protein n=1 Tax=Salinactinospora qingdaonensis TaxID=702744 RepID=UPI0031EF0035
MRFPLPRRMGALTAATAGAALLALTGCGLTKAGAAAVVDGEQITVETIEADMSAVEAQVAQSSNQQLPAGQRPQVASNLLSNRIQFLLYEQLAAEHDIEVDRSAVDAQIEEAGGVEAFLRQVPRSQVRDLVRSLLIQEELRSANAGELAQVAEGMREQQRQAQSERLEAMGMEGEQLQSQLDAMMAQIEPQIWSTAISETLVQPHAEAADIEVSPRYGQIDPTTLVIAPGSSPLSATENQSGGGALAEGGGN